MRIAVLLATCLLTGCFVVPAKTTTTRELPAERSSPRMGLSRGLTVSTKAEHSNVIVSVLRKRDCHREVSRVVEVTEHRRLRMGGVEDPRGAVFGALLAPVTLPISLLISGISVAANPTNRYEKRNVVRVETSACTQPAERIPVEVTLASGVSFTRKTDADGGFTFRLPSGEPYRGVIRVRAETEVAELKYRRKMPAVTTVREAVASCARDASFTGALEVKVTVNPAGLPTKVDLDHADTALTTCITTQIAEARFPNEQRDMTLVMPFSLGE